jgi:hypothetical protein
MSREQVKDKLTAVLNRPPQDGCEVIYALVKIRKVLEFDNSKRLFPFLNMLCDWVLHTQLAGTGAQQVVGMLDARLIQKEWKPEDDRDDRGLFDIFSLDLFRHDFRRFLNTQRLPLVWVDDMFAWQEFLVLYGDEVLNTPLKMATAEGKTMFLKEVVIEACEPSAAIAKANPEQKHSGFRWLLTLNNGRRRALTHTFNLAVRPEDWRTQGAIE